MMRLLLLLLAVVGALLLAAPAQAADEKAFKVTAKEITFTSGKDEVKGYLAMPEGKKGPFPAIVVIQEWWGLNDWIKENARRMAAQGYVCLAPDLYRGKVTDDMKVASALLK